MEEPGADHLNPVPPNRVFRRSPTATPYFALAVARNFSLELFGHRVRSACSPAAAAAAGIVSTVWLQSIRTVRITVDSDDGKNNHRRWFGIGVDIFAAAR